MNMNIVRPPKLSLSLVSIVAMHLVLGLMLCVDLSQSGRILPFVLLAYSFGVRHAFDPDHLAAIDNSVRLLRERGKAKDAGFYFSLGHASVVCLFALGGILGGQALQSQLRELESVGSIFGPLISSAFLIVLSSINLGFWLKNFGRLRNKKASLTQAHSHSLFTKIFANLLSRVKSSRQLLLVGFLFGLGLDTAIEVSVLAINGSLEPSSGNLLLVILPLAFTAGMCTFDTANSTFICRAYDTFAHDLKKRYIFTLVTLGLSVLLGFCMAASQLFNVFATNSQVLNALDLGNLGLVFTILIVLAFAALKLLRPGVKQDG